jgi:hypothetical protein
VVLMVYLGVALSVLASVAGVLTPVGLGEKVERGSVINATFEYAIDTSVFGTDTPVRDTYNISRSCGSSLRSCPGVDHSDFRIIPNPYSGSSGGPDKLTLYQPYVPENITNCFKSGTSGFGDLRSNPFEIQFRQYATLFDKNDTKGTNTTGDFVMLEKLIMSDHIVLREGLVIDMSNGGIGFRNHTVPTQPVMKHGATWNEDLLWIEPETVCVETNWTLEWSSQLAPMASSSYISTNELVLINGGFIGAEDPLAFPWYDRSNPQLNPDLKGRAHMAAWMFGLRVSKLLNLTSSNSSVGMRYNVTDDHLESVPVLFQAFHAFGGAGLFLGSLLDSTESYVPEPNINCTDNHRLINCSFMGMGIVIDPSNLLNATLDFNNLSFPNPDSFRPVINNLTTEFTFEEARM